MKSWHDTVFPSRPEIRWELHYTDEKQLCGVPTEANGCPIAKVTVCRGHLSDGSRIQVSREQMRFFNLGNFIRISRNYRGPWTWYCITITAGEDKIHDEHLGRGEDPRLEDLFHKAVSSCRKQERRRFLQNLRDAFGHLRASFL